VADPNREVAENSEQFLEAIDDLRILETQKRRTRISTPSFHVLADEIAARSRDVFKIADDERIAGNLTDRGKVTIEDVIEAADES
jgi:hypothetical protein